MTILLFLTIGCVALVKKVSARKGNSIEKVKPPQIAPPVEVSPPKVTPPNEIPSPKEVSKVDIVPEKVVLQVGEDHIERFFSKGPDRFPIMETIVYSSRVPWLNGRPAWIVDYANYYETSRHFIARSLNGRRDYFTQNISPGATFNVFAKDKTVEFYLLVDLSLRTMDFYYVDVDLDERVFVKSYPIGVGREDALSPSGSLTPTGKYALGSKVAIYKPGVEHYFQNQKVEMIQVFGTRWIPFEEAIENCTDRAKGYGIHGVPCHFDKEKDVLVEEEGGVGGYSSDGCIHLHKDDMEELFSIVITKRTVVEIVKDKKEIVFPMRKAG